MPALNPIGWLALGLGVLLLITGAAAWHYHAVYTTEEQVARDNGQKVKECGDTVGQLNGTITDQNAKINGLSESAKAKNVQADKNAHDILNPPKPAMPPAQTADDLNRWYTELTATP